MTRRINWRAPRWGFEMDEIRKNIRRVFWLYFILFAALAFYLAKFLVIDSKDIIASPYNPRLKLQNPSASRGDILDCNGKKLAYTDESGKRVYPLGSAAAHVVGYYGAGAAGSYGVEARYNFELENAGGEILQRLWNLISGNTTKCDSIVLTVDANLQSYVYKQIKDYRAGAIIIEPSTGKILAMVSAPGFDPNTLAKDFKSLSSDTENSPLINRASQGKYPPGSVFKIITAAAAMEYMPDYKTFAYTCAGSDTVGGKVIRCYDSTVHGECTLTKAFALSCNTFFANIGMRVGAGKLKTVAERFYFNTDLPFPLEYSVSDFPLGTHSADSETVDTAIGQGKTMTSPLQMALVTAVVANDGILMKPYILDHSAAYNGTITGRTVPDMESIVLTPDISAQIKDMMVDVTEYGTGSRAAVQGVAIAAKTGSAQTPSGADHGWYTAFFPADNPQYALCIVIENIGGSSRVLPIAKNIIKYLTN